MKMADTEDPRRGQTAGRRARKLPPQDSAISLAPGEKLTLDAVNTEEWKHQTRVLREARGNILSWCFAVEFALDRLISEIFFPNLETPGSPDYQNEDKQVLRDLFDELFLKGNRSNFASKIQLLKSLRTRLARLEEITNEDLISRLDSLRDVRNRFAHYPISFFPAQGESRQTFVAKLVCRDKDITLDQIFLQTVENNLRSVAEELQKAVTALRSLGT